MTRRAAVLVSVLAAWLSACGGESERDQRSTSPEDALRAALVEPAGLERVEGLVDAVSGLDSATAQHLADIMAGWGEPIPAYELRLLHATWAARDSDAALEYVLLLDREAPHRKNVAAQVVQVVASREPTKARIWVVSLPEDEPEEFRTAMAVALVEGWPASRVGFEGVSDLIGSMPFGFERERAARALVENLIDDGQLEETMRWAESIPEHTPGQFRAMVFRKVAVTAGKDSPQRIADWLDGHRAHRYGQAGLRVLARTWAERDAEEALRWALAQPDDRGRFLSVKFAFSSFYDRDRARASAWLATQPASPALDPAWLSYALSEMFEDSEAAASGALEIVDEATRDDILAKVVRHWFGRDAEGARAWIAASGLPQAYWTALLTPKRPQPRKTSQPDGQTDAGPARAAQS